MVFYKYPYVLIKIDNLDSSNIYVFKNIFGYVYLINCYYIPKQRGYGNIKKQNNDCAYNSFVNKDSIKFNLVYKCSETIKNTKLEEAIKKEFELALDSEVSYYYNFIDLNDDGNYEVFVYLVGSYLCGTGGCSGAIFRLVNDNYELLSIFSLVRNPVIISDTYTNGYKDIIMNVYGGGIRSFFARLRFDGKGYPSNPSVEPKVKPGSTVTGVAIVADDIGVNSGIKL